MRHKVVFLVLALILLAGFSYAGWRVVREREQRVCSACLRPVHLNMRTVATVNGKSKGYCCPACALAEHRQTGAAVTVASLTDYGSGEPLQPQSAYIVRGSHHTACSHNTGPAAGADKRPMEAHYDRCSPSLLSFASRDSAALFARDHGGKVLSFAEVEALFRDPIAR